MHRFIFHNKDLFRVKLLRIKNISILRMTEIIKGYKKYT